MATDAVGNAIYFTPRAFDIMAANEIVTRNRWL